MLFSNSREDVRQLFFTVWKKYQDKLPLEAQEKRILDVLLKHPEYHFIFKNPEKYLLQDYLPALGETNPFLHMGLHLAIWDQLSVNQPRGITSLYKNAIEVFADSHEAEHCLAHSLAVELAEMQSSGKPFDEMAYLKHIRKALKKGSW